MNEDKKKNNISRKKIINSAIILFAKKGFDSTSTREICNHAGVNLSLIPYYFKSKDGLYTNIIESIVDYGISFLSDDIAKLELLKSMAVDEKISLYKSILSTFANFIYSENVPASFIILMIKEQAVAHSKFSEIYSKRINILYKSLRKILASLLGKKENDKNIIIEVSAIIGQILSFKIMDRATLSGLKQDIYTKDDCKKIKNIILEYIDSAIISLNKRVSERIVLTK